MSAWGRSEEPDGSLARISRRAGARKKARAGGNASGRRKEDLGRVYRLTRNSTFSPRLTGGSAKNESGHALKMRVGTAQRHTMLEGQCGDPEVVGRYGRARLTELQKDPGLVLGGCFVRQQDRHARARQELPQRREICFLAAAGGESGAQLPKHNERNEDTGGTADDFDSDWHAAQEVAVGVGIERDVHLLPNFCVDLVKRPDRGVERRIFAPRTNRGIEIVMRAVPVGSPAVPIGGEPSGESRHFRVGKALDRVLNFGDGAHERKGADIACRFKSRFGARGRWRGFRVILKRSGEGAADSTAVAGTAAGVSPLQPRLRKVPVRSAARAVSMGSIQP